MPPPAPHEVDVRSGADARRGRSVPPGASAPPTRRALVAASGLAPALWLTRARVRPGARFQVAVIGCGIRARELLAGHFLPNERFRVVSVCEVQPERLAHFKALVDAHYGDTACRAEVDYREELARSDVDGVVIATPDHWHALQAIRACRAGKHVYCEKPLTRTLEEARRVALEARASGVTFQTGSQQRTEYGHRFVDAVERVRAGLIGRVLTVHVGVGDPPRPCDLAGEPCSLDDARAFDRWLGPAPARLFSEVLMPRGMHGHYPRWRDFREYAGGGLADMGAHHFDLAAWALGAEASGPGEPGPGGASRTPAQTDPAQTDPAQTGLTPSGPVRVEPPRDGTALRGAALVWASGARVVHGGPSGVTFVGTDGLLHIDRHRSAATPTSALEDPLPDGAQRLPRPADHAVDWLDALEARRPPACPAEVGARAAALCHLLNLAYRHRRALDWDPATFEFVDDDQANGWRSEPAREGYDLPPA